MGPPPLPTLTQTDTHPPPPPLPNAISSPPPPPDLRIRYPPSHGRHRCCPPSLGFRGTKHAWSFTHRCVFHLWPGWSCPPWRDGWVSPWDRGYHDELGDGAH